MKITTLTNKETGERYAAAVKNSWGQKYYSLNGGDTWFTSAKEARQQQPDLYLEAIALNQKFEGRA